MGGATGRFRMALKCAFCDLVAEQFTARQLLEHGLREHPGEVDSGEPELPLELVPIHLPCEVQCEPIEGPGRWWRCPRCFATFATDLAD